MNSEHPAQTFGGFLELEIGSKKNHYHKNALALSHGRACLAYILDQEKPKIVHVPFYACGVMIDPIRERNLEISRYAVDQALNPVGLPETIDGDELIIYINYFGLKSKAMEGLIDRYGRQLVADNCMAFFSRQYGDSYAYNSCRKFFGVPDGSYLYTPAPVSPKLQRYEEYLCDHLISRLGGQMGRCRGQFLENEAAFDCEVRGMSLLTERLMGAVDYQDVADRRRRNFLFVHERLEKHNRLQLSLSSTEVPHYYPFLPAEAPERAPMAKDGLFIPTLWPDMHTGAPTGFEFEIDLAKNLLPLPIDQRYMEDDMELMIDVFERHWTRPNC